MVTYLFCFVLGALVVVGLALAFSQYYTRKRIDPLTQTVHMLSELLREGRKIDRD